LAQINAGNQHYQSIKGQSTHDSNTQNPITVAHKPWKKNLAVSITMWVASLSKSVVITWTTSGK